MAAKPEGAPCWADAMFPDLEAAKSFYGDLLGWTFGESSEEYGNYTQAYSGGKNVAALSPQMPGWEGPCGLERLHRLAGRRRGRRQDP